MPDIITRALLESKGIPTRDIVAAIWGRKLSGGYEPAELTGTLPLTFRSNGTALLDYRIYGNTVETQGVGVRTENLFDPNAAEEDGDKIISDFMPLDPSELVLTMAFDIPLRASYNYEITYYDSTKTAISFVGGMGEAYKTRETVKLNRQSEAPNAAYVKVTLPKDLSNVLIQSGSADGAYIPYGYKLPMVSRTGNLFDGSYLSYGFAALTGEILDLSGRFAFYIPVEPNTAYTISRIKGASTYFCYGFTDAVPVAGMRCASFGNIGENTTTKTFANKNHKYLMFFFGSGKSENVMLVKGSTAPETYIPYHRTETPIYIGDTQLMQDEYVSYGEQKIYREVGGTLTPTDPPVPLPKLPTFSDADTVLDYEETPAPEDVWVKYQKGD